MCVRGEVDVGLSVLPLEEFAGPPVNPQVKSALRLESWKCGIGELFPVLLQSGVS